MKFQVGDRVKCIDHMASMDHLKENTEYEIEKIEGYYLKLKDCPKLWDHIRFISAPAPAVLPTVKCTRMRAGKDIEVPLDQIWNSIVKVIGRARVLCNPGEDSYIPVRRAFLNERLTDLDDITFHKIEQQ